MSNHTHAHTHTHTLTHARVHAHTHTHTHTHVLTHTEFLNSSRLPSTSCPSFLPPSIPHCDTTHRLHPSCKTGPPHWTERCIIKTGPCLLYHLARPTQNRLRTTMMIGLLPLAPIYDTVCRGGLGGVGRGWKGREARVELEWGSGGGGRGGLP